MLLESAGFIHQEKPHAHSPSNDNQASDNEDDHDAADGRCLLSNTQVNVPGPVVVLHSNSFCLWLLQFSQRLTPDIHASGLAPPGGYLPPISAWQFSLRTALSPRAPSAIS
jgi:hypothetical protein